MQILLFCAFLLLGLHSLSNFPRTFSHSDTSPLPTHAVHNQFELHTSASHIYFLISLFPCSMSNSCTPWELHLLTPGCSMGSRVYFSLNHVSLPPGILSSKWCCKFSSALCRTSSWLYIFQQSKHITTTEILNRSYFMPKTFFLSFYHKFYTQEEKDGFFYLSSVEELSLHLPLRCSQQNRCNKWLRPL